MNRRGKIDPTWLANARESERGDQTVEAWIGNWLKSPVKICDDGSVYLPEERRYLSDAEIDEVCSAVDNFA